MARDIVGAVLGVEAAQLIDVDTYIFADIGKGHVALNHHGVGAKGDGDALGVQAVFGIEVHDVGGGNEGRHIAAGFAGEIGVDLPEVLLPAAAGDGFVDVARSTVVGGNGQVPVAEDIVEVVEVVGGSVRRFVGIAAFVDDGVDLKAVVLAGGIHKLPQASGTDTRGGLGVHGGFDNGEVFQLLGYVVARQRFLEQRVVVLRQG